MTKRFIFALFAIVLGINMCRIAVMPEYKQIYTRTILIQASYVQNSWIDVVHVLADLRDDLYGTITIDFAISWVRLLFVDAFRILGTVLYNLVQVFVLIFKVLGLHAPFDYRRFPLDFH